MKKLILFAAVGVGGVALGLRVNGLSVAGSEGSELIDTVKLIQ